MRRRALCLFVALALGAGLAWSQADGGEPQDELKQLRQEVALLRERVARLEKRVKELEEIFEDDEDEPDAEAAQKLRDLAGPEDLKQAFLDGRGNARLILFVSPT